MARCFAVLVVLICASCGGSDSSYSPTSPSPPPTTPPPPSPPPPSYPTMAGAWNGTMTISAGTSNTCTMAWLLTQQSGGDFSGTWQTSGGTRTTCGQAGTLNGVIATTGAVSVRLTVTVGVNDRCEVVGSDGTFTGVFNGITLTAQRSDTVRCPGANDVARSVTISVR